jgi:hypothetical protein
MLTQSAVLAPPLSSDLELAAINTRIAGCTEAVKRARIAFLASTIASLAIFITEWNAYLSWYRHFPLSQSMPTNEVTREAFKDVLQQFVESRVITVSLLGIRVGVSDMAVLGSLTLLVCTIWISTAFVATTIPWVRCFGTRKTCRPPSEGSSIMAFLLHLYSLRLATSTRSSGV